MCSGARYGFLAVSLLLAILGLPPSAVAEPSRPVTVPALARWQGSTGAFDLRRDTRIVVRLHDRVRMRPEAAQLARDLSALVDRPVAVRASRRARARIGDVVIRSARGRMLGGRRREGYALRIDGTFSILATSRAGAFYGGRTLLQLVRGGDPIPRGRARDWPRYPERGLMVDNGRRFFSRRWLEQRIIELAGLKLNMLHLHLSDNEGFRVEIDSHPEAVTPPFLSKRDVRRLVAVAKRHHVTLVPEIDAPGHMRAALRAHPELQLADAEGRLQADKLDVTDPRARRFVFDLIDELAPLFPGPYWHTGGDEYLGPFATDADYLRYPQLEQYADAKYGADANGKDAVLDFLNAVGERVREHGKELRLWSDGVGGGAALHTDPRSSVMWWEEGHSPSPEDLVAAGHQVVNAGWWPTYYVTGGPLERLRTPVEQMYEGWQPWSFSGPYSPRWGLGPAAPAAGALAPRRPPPARCVATGLERRPRVARCGPGRDRSRDRPPAEGAGAEDLGLARADALLRRVRRSDRRGRRLTPPALRPTPRSADHPQVKRRLLEPGDADVSDLHMDGVRVRPRARERRVVGARGRVGDRANVGEPGALGDWPAEVDVDEPDPANLGDRRALLPGPYDRRVVGPVTVVDHGPEQVVGAAGGVGALRRVGALRLRHREVGRQLVDLLGGDRLDLALGDLLGGDRGTRKGGDQRDHRDDQRRRGAAVGSHWSSIAADRR